MVKPLALPQLEDLRIASPCSMRWDDMVGDARSRHCGACRLNVYDISAMTREEAMSFIVEKEGRACIRLHRRADGTVVTRNCPVGVRRVRHAVVRAAGSLAAVAALAVGAFASLGERLKGRSVRISQTEPYVSLVKLLRTDPLAASSPPPIIWMGAIDIPLTATQPFQSSADPSHEVGPFEPDSSMP